MKKIIPLLSLLAVLSLSCNITMATPPNYEIEEGFGALTLNLSSDVRTLLPDVSIDVDHYSIAATYDAEPLVHFFSVDLGSGVTTHTENNLIPGDWSLTVTGFNVTNDPIAQYTTPVPVLVTDNITTDISITVSPIAGLGTLSLTVNIQDTPDVLVTLPDIEAYLTPVGGAQTTIEFTLSDTNTNGTNDQGVYTSGQVLPDGYYLLELILWDDTDVVWGAVESVRIIADELTSHTWNLDDVVINEYLAGGLDFVIDSDMELPYDITFDTPDFTLNKTPTPETLTVAATLDPADPPDSGIYRWFINGIEQSTTTSSITVNADDHDPGVYKLELVVLHGGTTLSSNYVTFTVVE